MAKPNDRGLFIGIAVVLVMLVAIYLYSTNSAGVSSAGVPSAGVSSAKLRGMASAAPSAGAPRPLTPKKWGTWPTDAWLKANHSKIYLQSDMPYEDCERGCLNDPQCLTMTGFMTYPKRPKASCRHFSVQIPETSINTLGGAWEGTVNNRSPVA